MRTLARWSNAKKVMQSAGVAFVQEVCKGADFDYSDIVDPTIHAPTYTAASKGMVAIWGACAPPRRRRKKSASPPSRLSCEHHVK